MTTDRVGVVIPALNEARTVGNVVRGVLSAVPGAVVIVVDDGSTDGTGAFAAAAGARVVTHDTPGGYATALRDGFAAALDTGVDRIVQLDADGQHRPQDIPRLLDALDGHDLVVGSRFSGSSYAMDTPRRIGIGVCRAMARVCGVRVTDPTSGFRAMRVPLARAIARDGFPGGLTESSYLIGLRRQGVAIGEIPVTMLASQSGSMHDGLEGVWHLGRIVRASAATALRRRPR